MTPDEAAARERAAALQEKITASLWEMFPPKPPARHKPGPIAFCLAFFITSAVLAFGLLLLAAALGFVSNSDNGLPGLVCGLLGVILGQLSAIFIWPGYEAYTKS